MTDQQTISVYDSQIDSYVELIKKEKSNPLLLRFIQRVEAGGFVLDLGCGPAIAAATMREHGLRVDPVDASPQMVQLANDSYQIGARLAQFSDIRQPDIYDGIWANFSLLHASREQFPQLLDALTLALKHSGIFHLGMKLGEGSKRDKLGRFYSYYSEQELTSHLLERGFSIDKIKLAEGKGLAGDYEPWIILQAIAGNKTEQ